MGEEKKAWEREARGAQGGVPNDGTSPLVPSPERVGKSVSQYLIFARGHESRDQIPHFGTPGNCRANEGITYTL
jgi:hypothetical protein